MALPKYNQESKDYYDLKAPVWANEMAKQYNKDTEEDNLKSITQTIKEWDEKNSPIDANLKTAAAINKPRVSDVPPVALFALGAAMSDGATKYGRFNWRKTGSTSSVFYDAMIRHLVDWYNGEDYAHDSNVHHLGHVMASCAIILDSAAQNSLNDDRLKVTESVARSPELWKKL